MRAWILLLIALGTLDSQGVEPRPDPLAYGRPSREDDEVARPGYVLGYREAHEQAAWVAYCLRSDDLRRRAGRRRDVFRADPEVATGSAAPEDYAGSGYDRGHLAPAADQSWSQEAADQSFFMSNMSPQVPAFNRGVWSRLEALVRDLALARGELWVVTGPVLEPGLPHIGAAEVSVPRAYYKVILDPWPAPRALAFLLPNAPSRRPPAAFTVPVDEVERRTGLDFLSELPDSLEARLEAAVDTTGWGLGAPQRRAAARR